MWQDWGKSSRAAARASGAVRFLASVAIAAVVAGCASMSPGIDRDASPEQKQKIVGERAEARWQALIKGDLDSAYTFLSPASRAATPIGVYKGKIKPGLWRQAKVHKVSCEAEVCRVDLLITYDAKRMKGIETPLTESWIIENGNAWYVYR